MKRRLLVVLDTLISLRELAVRPPESQPVVWHREERLHHSVERRYWRYSFRLTCLIVVGALASAVFTGWAALEGSSAVREAHRQADEAHRQAELARLQLINGVRAWLRLEQPIAEAISWRARTSRDGSPDHGELALVLNATNVGNSPSLETRLYARSVIVSAIEEATNYLPSTLGICAEPGAEDDVAFRNTVFPQTKRSQASKVSLGQAAFASSQGNALNPSSSYIVVCAAYTILGEGGVFHHTARVFTPMRAAQGDPSGASMEPIRFEEQLTSSQIKLRPAAWGDEAN